MKKRSNHHLVLALKQLSKKINVLIQTGQWELLTEIKKAALTRSLKNRFNRVKSIIAKRRLSRILGAACVLLSTSVSAQTFAPPVENPFGIAEMSSYFTNKVDFGDIDGDGDLDLFYRDSDNNLIYQENIGDETTPNFEEPETNPFSVTLPAGAYLPQLSDLDGDGDLDILLTASGEVPHFIENTGTELAPNFAAAVASPFGIETTDDNFLVDIVDIDDDGDYDLIYTNYQYDFDEGIYSSSINYMENTGTSTAPAFAASVENPFGLTTLEDSYYNHIVDFADLDGDGDVDFIRSYPYYSNSDISYGENTGTSTVPAFAGAGGVINPFGLTAPTDGNGTTGVAFVDIDGDGDFDIFASSYYYGNTIFYENISPVASECPGEVSVESTDLTCFGANDGTIGASVEGGDGPFSYDIGGDANLTGIFTDLEAGEYTLTIVDVEECEREETITIADPDEIVIDAITTDITCNGEENGTVDTEVTGGVGTLSFSLGDEINTTGSFADLSAGEYTLTVTDENECEAEEAITITEPEAIVAAVTAIDASCFGEEDGEITVDGTGGTGTLEYDLNDETNTTGSFSGLEAGSYTLTITDENDCEYEETVTVDEPDGLSVTSTTDPEAEGNDGSIDVTVSGGTGDYSYSWTGPDGYTSDVEDPIGLSAGIYSLTVTDDNGCTFTIDEIEVLSTVSIGEDELGLKIFPNPSNDGIFTLENNGNNIVSIQVTDLTGRLVFQDNQVSNVNLYKLDLSSFEDGAYIVQLNLEKSKQVKRVVKR